MRIKLDLDVTEVFTTTELRNLIAEHLYAVMRQQVQDLVGDPPLSEVYACHMCNRRGDTVHPVIDKYPTRPDYRNRKDRFMHRYGVCPVPPDKAPENVPCGCDGTYHYLRASCATVKDLSP